MAIMPASPPRRSFAFALPFRRTRDLPCNQSTCCDYQMANLKKNCSHIVAHIIVTSGHSFFTPVQKCPASPSSTLCINWEKVPESNSMTFGMWPRVASLISARGPLLMALGIYNRSKCNQRICCSKKVVPFVC